MFSQLPVTSRIGAAPPAPSAPPAAANGAQLTERQPSVLSWMSETAHESSSWCAWIETLPSLLAHASTSPCSCGAHATELTLAVCPRYWYTGAHVPGGDSRCTSAAESYEHDASSTPYRGCAHATSHTGPSWPAMLALSACCAPSTSQTLIVRSDDAVASLRE